MCDQERFRVLAAPFSRGLRDKAHAYRVVALSEQQRSRLRESIAVDVRKFCDIAIPEARCPEISMAAQQVAATQGIDLRNQTWHTQSKIDPGRQRFHYEHVTPISTSVASVLACSSSWDVVRSLEATIRVAWVTKEEDRELTRLGFRHKRPDPDAAYAAAGIVLCATHDPAPPDEDDSYDDSPPEDLHEFIAWLRSELQHEINDADTHHEAHCRDPQLGRSCSCGNPTLIAEDATSKIRMLSRLEQREEPEALTIVARLLAFRYRESTGYKTSWHP